MALVMLNIRLYPMPPGVSFDDPTVFGDYIVSPRPTAYLLVFAAHFGQAVVGGYLAARLAEGRKAADYACYVLGALTMIGSIVNTASLPVPAWTWLEIPVYPFLAWYTALWAAAAVAGTDQKAK